MGVSFSLLSLVSWVGGGGYNWLFSTRSQSGVVEVPHSLWLRFLTFFFLFIVKKSMTVILSSPPVHPPPNPVFLGSP